ncbi:hypothetical protein [Roseateles noduli]|uniref:hypothetical protein n=1 Tax=Roseateles noduli TaxID=2052484 RepID=UPI003D657C84
MRLDRFFTWICTAVFAGTGVVYGVALLLLLVDGRMVEFSKLSTGRSYTWADSPGMLIVNTLAHATLLSVLFLLARIIWRTQPDVHARRRRPSHAMTGRQWAALSFMAFTLIATCVVAKLGLPTGAMRRPALLVIWLLWLGTCTLGPLWALMTGQIRTESERIVRRSDDPKDFWRRWIKIAACFALVLGIATMVCWSKW